jgi:hypothetical protein
MTCPKLCYILMGVPKYRDMTPEEHERRSIKVMKNDNTMICELFGECSTSPTWCPMPACFSN